MIILTGSEGYIGKNLKTFLGASDVLCIDRNLGRPVESLTHEEIKGADFIVHLAAHSNIAEMESKPSLTLENIKGTLHVARLIEDCSPRPYLIFSSSSAIHYPTTDYGKAKLIEERLVEYVDGVAFRFYNIVGGIPDESQNDHIIPNLFRAVKEGKPFKIYGDGSNRRDYVYVGDLCKLIVEEMKSLKQYGSQVEVASKSLYSVLEVVEEVERVMGRKINVEFAPRREGDILEIKSPPYGVRLESGLRRAVEDYKRSYGL